MRMAEASRETSALRTGMRLSDLVNDTMLNDLGLESNEELSDSSLTLPLYACPLDSMTAGEIRFAGLLWSDTA